MGEQPPWGSERSRPPFQPHQPPAVPSGPPSRKGWSGHRKVTVVLGGTLGAFILLGVIGEITGAGKQQTPVAATSAAATASPTISPPASSSPSAHPEASAKPKHRTVSPEDACENRPPASGDVYIFYIDPGLQDSAQEIGGEWGWNYTTHTCQTSVQETIATSPTEAGYCTEVGYVADNPGYDVNATPAKRLENVAAESGPAC